MRMIKVVRAGEIEVVKSVDDLSEKEVDELVGFLADSELLETDVMVSSILKKYGYVYVDSLEDTAGQDIEIIKTLMARHGLSAEDIEN